MILHLQNGRLITSTGVDIGTCFPEDDGFYRYVPNDGCGSFDESSLRLIAGKLEELNEPYKKQIDRYFKSQP